MVVIPAVQRELVRLLRVLPEPAAQRCALILLDAGFAGADVHEVADSWPLDGLEYPVFELREKLHQPDLCLLVGERCIARLTQRFDLRPHLKAAFGCGRTGTPRHDLRRDVTVEPPVLADFVSRVRSDLEQAREWGPSNDYYAVHARALEPVVAALTEVLDQGVSLEVLATPQLSIVERRLVASLLKGSLEMTTLPAVVLAALADDEVDALLVAELHTPGCFTSILRRLADAGLVTADGPTVSATARLARVSGILVS